jgi:calcium-translocating P-type ATPase
MISGMGGHPRPSDVGSQAGHRSTHDLEHGLSEAEAARRLAADGPNVLPTPRRRSAVGELAAQLVHFFALMLWVAGVLALVAGLPELGVAIFVVVVVNGVFAFIQEARAERAAGLLRDLLPRRATVIRDGMPRAIGAEELVVGDVVRLEAGDRVPADLDVGTGTSLAVDTATLTGESVPAHVPTGSPAFAGTFVVEGEARAIVRATGTRTRLAEISRLTTSERRPRSPLAIELDRVVRLIAVVAVGIGTAFFLVSVLLGMSPSDGFLFAIGVTVALVPEGLLPTVTLSLAVAAQRMAARHALVRRLEAVETLGSTTFVCTDKTGTLTRNEMEVVAVWTPAGTTTVRGTGYDPVAEVHGADGSNTAAAEAALAAVRASTGRAVEVDGRWIAHGDPMEAAIDALGRRLGVDLAAATRSEQELRRYPFDPRRRRMSVVVGDRLCVKGAPDSVLARCDGVPAGATVALDAMARRGLRVLAVAERPIGAGGDGGGVGPDEMERHLVLRALLGLEDPPRAGAAGAIARCRRAGIAVMMVTGDHRETALAIAREVGLAVEGSPVLEGGELPLDDDELGELLDRDGAVLARVAPEDKLRIAAALQRRGHVVAMTGDGVNDGPALQAADIGVAMGRSGTDVAREAADLVLLDDDFATIVAAVEQGRATFTNIRRFLTYHLTDNVAELTPFVVWALSGGSIPLALTVLQVLALDIGTDLLPALALGAEAPDRYALEGRPRRRHLLDRGLFARVFGVLGPTEAMVEMAAFMTTYLAAGWRPGDSFSESVLLPASGAAFAAVVLGQIANAFACRSTRRSVFQIGWRTNRLLLLAVVAELVALAAFLWIPLLADLLRHAPPTAAGAAVAMAAIPAVIGVDALAKRRLALREAGGDEGHGR